MYSWPLRPLLFLLPPDIAHSVALAALGPLERSQRLRAVAQRAMRLPRDERLVVRAMGVEFATPVGLAAGFDKNARRALALSALGFAHLEIGTVTAQAQAANPKPNLFRLPADRALVNRLGFPNDGAARVARRLQAVRPQLQVPVGVSIGKSRAVPIEDLDAVIQDYTSAFDAVCESADFVVVNVSSPNTAGLRSLQWGGQASALLGALAAHAAGGPPLLLKVGPDLDDAQMEGLLAVVEQTGLRGVVATNTTVARAGLVTSAKRVEAIGDGGLSGAPLRARALQIVRRARVRLGHKSVVIGVGGVERAEHAMALIRAGANLVQLYTGFIYEGPGAPNRIGRELAAMVEREGVRSIEELVGVDAARSGV